MIRPFRFGIACGLVMMMASVARAVTGGIVIANAVAVTYSDGSSTYTGRSNTVQVTTAQISALVVSPKNAAANAQTDGFPVGAQVTRTFTLSNSSNITDAYTIVAAGASVGSIVSIAFVNADGSSVPATPNTTRSPAIDPGASINVAVTVATTGVGVGTAIAITLTARTTVAGTTNGVVSDTGQQWAVATGVPQFGGPTGVKSSILKTVDTLRSEAVQPGQDIVYQIAFQNYGQSAATNAVLTDIVPAGIAADPTSVTVNGRAMAAQVNGQTLTVALGSIAPQSATTVAFNAHVAATQTIGASYVNVASLAADGIALVGTTPASVFAGAANVVFDGYSGSKTPIANAVVALVDSITRLPVTIPATTSALNRASAQAATPAIVNAANANPFTTGASGTYGFAIPPPAAGSTASYDLLIAAPGYLSRDIGVVLTPDSSDLLYSVALTSKDGQPLAKAGGFALTGSNVMLADVFGLLGNLPLFSTKPITVNKTADKPSGAPGDRVGYTIGVTTTAASGLGVTNVTDTLPAGLAFAPSTARVDGVATEPLHVGRQLIWQLASLATNVTHTITYAGVILPSVTPQTTLTNSVNVSGLIPGTTINASGFGSVSIVTKSGIFSERGAITGRVFLDVLGDARYREGDTPVPGVRIVLEDGVSVTTDSDGRFSFHGVRSGMHVLRLDETTLPANARAYADRRYDSVRSPLRLIHGTLDAGLLQDITFAVEPKR